MNQDVEAVKTSRADPGNTGRLGMLERRKWVRFILPELVTRLSWKNQERTESRMVNLVDISGEIAAVMLDFQPNHHFPYMFYFDNGKSGPVTAPAHLISTKAVEYGKILATFKFDLTEAPTNYLPKQRERRAWERRVPKEKSAVLCWADKDSEVSVCCEMLNLSGGGTALKIAELPPVNETLWLSVGPPGHEVGPVECEMVACSPDGAGSFTLRLSFVGLCPLSVFEAAMGMES
ncbi:MAG: PilZ domain-containing protein [Isosphaeraceae bacterium]